MQTATMPPKPAPRSWRPVLACLPLMLSLGCSDDAEDVDIVEARSFNLVEATISDIPCRHPVETTDLPRAGAGVHRSRGRL